MPVTVVTALPRRPAVSRRTFTRPPASRWSRTCCGRALRRSPSSLEYTRRAMTATLAELAQRGLRLGAVDLHHLVARALPAHDGHAPPPHPDRAGDQLADRLVGAPVD